MTEKERAREEIAKIIVNTDESEWKIANQILAIDGIEIRADDQSLPPIPERFKVQRGLTSVYDEGWRNGYAWLRRKLVGFIRVIPEEK